MPHTVRTFIAVETPAEIQQRISQLVKRLQAAPAKVKWVAPHQVHWTIKFLGEVELNEVPAVCRAVERAVAPLAPFDLEARGAGAFPDANRPRTVWMGAGDGSERMVELHDAVESALAELGYRTEGRRFRPHLTIGRVRNSDGGSVRELGKLLAAMADFDGGVSYVDEVVVFSSELGRDGPTYEPLGHAALAGGT
jgi:2'-5' RNA ligase